MTVPERLYNLQSDKKEKVVAKRPQIARQQRQIRPRMVLVNTTDREVKMPDIAEIVRTALSLDTRDRAALAERLLASLEELSEEEAECLWAEEAQRRLQEYRAGHAKAAQAAEVHRKAEGLLRSS